VGFLTLDKSAEKVLPYLIYFVMQGKHRSTLLFQNDTENKCGVLRNSHQHQLIEKLLKFCIHLTKT
jgi:hypothetical protein